jgi:hypothetical protein
MSSSGSLGFGKQLLVVIFSSLRWSLLQTALRRQTAISGSGIHGAVGWVFVSPIAQAVIEARFQVGCGLLIGARGNPFITERDFPQHASIGQRAITGMVKEAGFECGFDFYLISSSSD